MNTKHLRKAPLVAGIATLALAFVGCAQSADEAKTGEDYPAAPIDLIVTAAPGGGSDLTARAIGPLLAEELGQPVKVINRPGASGALGLQEISNAEPDGYTIGIEASGRFTVNPLSVDVPYTLDDFTGYIGLIESPLVITTRADAEWADFDALIAAGKQGRTIRFGYPGTILRMLPAKLFSEAGVKAVGVPFDSGGEANTAMLAGDVDVIAQAITAGVPLVEGGKARFLTTFTPAGIPTYPDVPTTEEAGYGAVGTVARKFLVLPASTPDEIVAKVRDAAETVIEDPKYQTFLDASEAAEPSVGGDELKSLFLKERETYEGWVDELGLSFDG